MFSVPGPGGDLPARRGVPHPEGQLRLLAGAAASIQQVRLEPREGPVNLSIGRREEQPEGIARGDEELEEREQPRENEAGNCSQDQPLDLSLESGLKRRAL
jgi:hypothetical protein